MNKWIKYSIIFGTSCSVLFSVVGCSNKSKDISKAVPTLVSPVTEEIRTQTVRKGTIERTGTRSGYISPVKKVDMCFKFKGGYLSKLNVKAGDIVKQGQILAELDTSDTKYAIKQEEIKLKQAQLSYDNAVQSGSSDIQKQILQLNIEAENLKLNQLKEDLKNSVLTADISGKVINVADVRISQFISGYQPLVTIADPNSIQVQCDGNLPDFAVGCRAIIRVVNTDYNGEVVTNTLQQGGNSQNNKVVIKFLDEVKNVEVGDSVTVICTFERKENVIVIPYKAVRIGEDGHNYVRLKDKDDIIERYVEIGIRNDDKVEITSGLSEDETIIIN